MTGCASEPSDPSQPGTGARGTPIAAFAAYLLLAFAAAWPLSGSPRSLLPGDPSGDTGVYIWNLWIFGHQLLAHAASPLYTSHILFPGPPIDLALHNYTIFQNTVGLVLVPWLGLVGAFNVTWLVMQALSGFGVFLLARRCTRRPSVAWLAGALFAWSPTMVARSTAHQSLLAAGPLALFLYFALRAADSRQVRHAVLAGACAAWAAVCDAYYGIYCAPLLAWVLAARSLRWTPFGAPRPATRAATLLTALVGALGLIVVAILVSGGSEFTLLGRTIRVRTLYTPMLILAGLLAIRGALAMRRRGRWTMDAVYDRTRLLQLGAGVFVCALLISPLLNAARVRLQSGGSLQEQVLWRSSPPGADLLAFFVPNPNHPLLPDAVRDFVLTRPDSFAENVVSIPYVALVTIGLGLLRRPRPSAWLVLAAAGFLLALGPFLIVAHTNTQFPGPWAVLRYVPILGAARTPTRFAIPMLIAIAVLFAWAIERLGWRRPALVAVALAMICELWPVPRATASARVPGIYTTIAADPEDVSVLEVPFGIWDGTTQTGAANIAAQYYQAAAHQKRLLGGYLSRIPPRRVRQQLAFPTLRLIAQLSEGKPGSGNLAEAAREDAAYFVQQSRLRYVVVDPRRASPELREAAIQLLQLRLLRMTDGLELYTTGLRATASSELPNGRSTARTTAASR